VPTSGRRPSEEQHGDQRKNEREQIAQAPDPAMADQPSSSRSSRTCGFSRCRKALPVDGTGRKREYCAESDTSWPVEGRSASCRELGRAERLLFAVNVTSGAVTEPNIVELGERIDAAIDPITRAVRPIAQLLDTLTRIREQLDSAVARARTEREEALRNAADAHSRAELAESRAAAAERAATEAESARVAAERAAAHDREARARAEREQIRADGRLDEVQAALGRAEQRLISVTERADNLEVRLAHTRGELNSARETLDQERQRATGEQDRAERARAAERDRMRAEHESAIEGLRDDYERHLEKLRQQHVSQLNDARLTAEERAQRIRDQVEHGRQAEAERHATQLGELHQRVGQLSARLTEALGAARSQVEQHAQWRAALGELLAKPSETDPDRLRERIEAFLDSAPRPLDTGDPTKTG
jgi:chromosome segregation ATPase